MAMLGPSPKTSTWGYVSLAAAAVLIISKLSGGIDLQSIDMSKLISELAPLLGLGGAGLGLLHSRDNNTRSEDVENYQDSKGMTKSEALRRAEKATRQSEDMMEIVRELKAEQIKLKQQIQGGQS